MRILRRVVIAICAYSAGGAVVFALTVLAAWPELLPPALERWLTRRRR